jgi:GNAT superfamily N-acetyltransferase
VRAGETLYSLQLLSLADLVPARRETDLGVVEEHDPECIRRTTLAIGSPLDWPTQHWDDQQWDAYLQRDDLHHWVALEQGDVVGLASLRLGPREVEIDTFGLLPEHTGRGLGGDFLCRVVRLAWQVVPAAHRVWLHTSSADHPAALRNYESRGFRVFRVRLPPVSETDQLELAADVVAHARSEFARYDQYGYELGLPHGSPLSEGREPELHEIRLGHWWQGEHEIHVVDAGRGLQLVYRNRDLAYPVLHPIERFAQAVAHRQVELHGPAVHYGGWH